MFFHGLLGGWTQVDLEDGPAEWGWQDSLSVGGAGVLRAGLSVGAGAAQRSRLLVALT